MPRAENTTSVGRRHDDDPRHHAPVLVLEDVAVVDEFPELGERDVEDLRGRLAMAAAPLRDGADAVLVVQDLIRDAGIRRRHAQGEVVLDHAAVAARHHETRLVHVEIVVFGRQLDQLPRLSHGRLTWSEWQADDRVRRVELFELARGRFLRPRYDFSILVYL